MKDGFLHDYRQEGNTFCYMYYGISYWTPEDCKKLQRDFVDEFAKDGGKDLYWEFVPFVNKKENYNVEIRQCRRSDIIEIDNYNELLYLNS